MGTAAAFLACYCPLCLSAPGKPSDPGISSESLPAEPGIQQGASRRSHVLMHVDPGDALVQHFHALATSCSGTPLADGNGRAACQDPGSVQETDTRARSSSGGYPAWGPCANLTSGLERSKANRRRRAARQHNCAPSAPPPPARSPPEDPGRLRPAPASGARGPSYRNPTAAPAKRANEI